VPSTLARVEPRFSHIPSGDFTLGPKVGELCDRADYGPDAEQQVCLNGIFAQDVARRQSSAFAIVLLACRQNLKTGIEKQAGLGWLFLLHIDPIVWTAHEWDTVEEAFRDLDELIAASPYLRRQIRTVNREKRDMKIITRGGGRMLFKTRTPGGGRGLTGEKIILDEGWKLRDSHIGSLLPTLSARSMTGDPQVIYGSSAAHEDSEVLHPLIERGRAASVNPAAARLERRLMYVEWCAPDAAEICDQGTECSHALDTPGCGFDKPDYVQMANPAVGRRISMDFILTSERRNLDPHEYGRERMGWHDKPIGQAVVIPLVSWAAALDEGSEPRGSFTLSVVYTSDKQRAAIGLAGRRRDGGWHVELADYLDTAKVTARVKAIITRAARRGRVCAGIAIDKGGHEAAAIKPLTQARLPVRQMTTGEVCTAFSGFYQAVVKEHSLHHRGQDDLTVALVGAGTRPVGDAGEAWGRKISGVEIAPVVAVTHARWLHEEEAPDEEAEPSAWAL